MNHKTSITLALSAIALLWVQSARAQSVGISLSTGSYSAKQENSLGNAVPTQGSLYQSAALCTEWSLGKGVLPVSLSIDQFQASMDANAVQSVVAKANTVKLGTGYTLRFADEQSKKQPFVGVGLDAEVFNRASYRYTDEQQGNLDWKNNVYFSAIAGVRFSRADVHFDVFAKYAAGTRNRISSGSYTDQTFTIGTRLLIQP